MSPALHQTLLMLEKRDLDLRAQLQTEGTLFAGYDARMQVVHRENAAALRTLIETHGWPNERLAGADGAHAAWLVAQHAISEPDFMRSCLALLEREAAAGNVPVWQYAYLDDRIRIFEGRPQRFGTQIEMTPAGAVLCETEDLPALDARRREAGLESIAKRLRSLRNQPRPTSAEYAARKEAEQKWRAQVGWCDVAQEPR